MKNDNELLFDDRDTSETMYDCFVQIYGELTDEELDKECERIKANQKNID